MRRVSWILLIAACSAQPPPPSNAPATAQNTATPGSVEIPPAVIPPPAEPTGLVVLARPARSVCELKGPVREGGFDLRALAAGPSFANVASGEALLSLGEDGSAFAEVRLSSSTVLRGFAARGATNVFPQDKTAVLVYAKRWLAFGGVFYPGAVAPMRIQQVKGGKIVVATHGGMPSYFALDESAQAMEVACADISITQDPEGELQKQAAPAFLATGKEQFMWLTGTKPVPVSALADGPAKGSFTLSADDPIQVVVLERRGPRARVRHLHIAGWIDTARLSAKEPKDWSSGGLGLVGMLNTGAKRPSNASGTARRVSCNADVRLVAELGASRFVVGAIPRGQGFAMTEGETDLAYLSFDGSAVTMSGAARLAVPARDAVGCAEAPAGAPDALPKWSAELGANEPIDEDAVSKLPDDPAGKKREAVTYGRLGIRSGGDRGPPDGIFERDRNDPDTTSKARKAPKLKAGAVTVSGRLPPEVVTRIVRQSFGRFRMCYEQGLAKNPALAGRVSVRFVIKADGTVGNVSNGGSSLGDAAVVPCVLSSFYGLSFPQPESGIVVVLFPIEFSAD